MSAHPKYWTKKNLKSYLEKWGFACYSDEPKQDWIDAAAEIWEEERKERAERKAIKGPENLTVGDSVKISERGLWWWGKSKPAYAGYTREEMSYSRLVSDFHTRQDVGKVTRIDSTGKNAVVSFLNGTYSVQVAIPMLERA